jgi:hypothetical protein
VETGKRILREGLLRALTDAELGALRRGLASDDPALQQGLMTLPPLLECLHDWEVEGGDLFAYPVWRAWDLVTVKEVEEDAWALISLLDARFGEGTATELLRWYDVTPRAEMGETLLAEVDRQLIIRMLRQAAGVAGRTA